MTTFTTFENEQGESSNFHKLEQIYVEINNKKALQVVYKISSDVNSLVWIFVVKLK